MKIAVRRTPSISQNSSGEPSLSLIRLVRPTGTTKKRPIAKSIEKRIVTPHSQPPISSLFPSSSGSIWAFAEIASARNPIFSDSPRATTPRITGSRQTRCRRAHGRRPSELISISPSGLRTATAQVETPRIITPSSTAWPPTGASRFATRAPSGMRSGSAPLPDSCVRGSSLRSECSAGWRGSGLTRRSLRAQAYFRALACLAARRWNRSTRPPVSTSFCLPV